MIRWHKSICYKPIIQVDNGDTPRCTSCGCRCPWRELAASNGSSNSALNIPESEPSGQMNLRWPPSVPYKSMREIRNADLSQTLQQAIAVEKEGNKTTKPQTQPLHGSSLPSQTSCHDPADSPIYGRTLAPDEFRLAYIAAAEDDKQPLVHVSLEVYKDSNCPEYEAVSYTWGGEDGDYSLSRPIFIGPFWDVVFQTKNCWDMLRFVRPWRGTRIVWVDALCINQGNITERLQQVAKMGRIYEHCLRVIVYLGSDLVLPLPRGEFPSRCRLFKLENGSIRPRLPANHKLGDTPLNLRELLKRQYFSRVWVIQELLLSRSTIIRVGDVDFWTDSAPWPADWAEDSPDMALDWGSTQAPWVQYLAQKTFPVTSILDVLRATSHSRASDPRDRIFGLLGLIPLDDIREGEWQPDYSLSPQHVFIGFFAHFITNLSRFDFLLFAAGLATASSSPSWVPDWSPQESWQRLLAELPSHVKIEASTHLYDEPVTSFPILYWTKPLNHMWVSRAALDRPWNKDIAVHTKTGALSLNLTHFCSIPAQPARVKQPGTTTIFKVGGKNRGLYLESKHSLDTVVIPGQDHVFILISGVSDPIYFILRETDNHGTFRLVAPCTQLFIYPDFEGGSCGWRLGSLHYQMTHVCKKMEWCVWRDMGLLFPGADEGWDILPMLKGLQGEPSGPTRTFERAYLSCVSDRFHPRIQGGYIELTLPVGEAASYDSDVIEVPNSLELWNANLRQYSFTTVKVGWEWRKWNTWTPITDKGLELVPVMAKRSFRIRVPLDIVRNCCDIWFDNVAAVQRALGVSYDELVDVLEEGPQEKHHFIACPSLRDQNDMEDFSLNIYTGRVLVL